MNKKVKIILIIALCVVAVAGTAVYLTAPLKVEFVELAPQTALLTFTEEGVFDYDNRYEIYPLISGEVLQISAEEGQWVNKGDVIAIVNATDYQHQIEQMQSSVKGYNGQIYSLAQQEQLEKDSLRGQRRSLEGQLASLNAQIERGGGEALEFQIEQQIEIIRQDEGNVRWAYELVKLLRNDGLQDTPEFFAAQQALNLARKAQAASEAQLEALKVSDASLDGQRQSIQAQIDAIDERLGKSYTGGMASYYQSMIESANAGISQLEEQMGKAEIVSPVDGRVVSLPIADTNVISSQGVVAVIGSGELVEVYIPMRELDGVKAGDEVELILDKRLGEEHVGGKVVFLDDKAEVKLSALGVEERKVRALIKPDDANLMIGYSMDVRFTVLSLPDSLIIPKTALFKLDGADCVWVLDEQGKAQLRQVVRGVETRDGFAVTDGLSAGDSVVRDANQDGLAVGVKLQNAQ